MERVWELLGRHARTTETIIHVLMEPMGHIVISDRERADAQQQSLPSKTLAFLRLLCSRAINATLQKVAAKMGITEVRSEGCFRRDKVAAIRNSSRSEDRW